VKTNQYLQTRTLKFSLKPRYADGCKIEISEAES